MSENIIDDEINLDLQHRILLEGQEYREHQMRVLSEMMAAEPAIRRIEERTTPQVRDVINIQIDTNGTTEIVGHISEPRMHTPSRYAPIIDYEYSMSDSHFGRVPAGSLVWGEVPFIEAMSDVPRSMNPEEVQMYVTQLCAQTGRSFDRINMLEYKELTNKTEINKLFFTGEKPEIDTTLNETVKLEINRLFREANPLNALRAEITQYQSQLRDASRRHQDNLSSLVEAKRRLNIHKNLPNDYHQNVIKNIISKGNWTLSSVDNRQLCFTLTNDCILTWKDEDKGVDVTVNLGKFKLVYRPAESRILVNKYKDNIVVDENYHPHIGAHGGACWGNAEESIKNAMESFDVEKIAEIVFLLLHEYNDESPYAALTEFKEVSAYIDGGRHSIFSDYLEREDVYYEYSNFDTNDHESREGTNYHTIVLQIYINKITQKKFIKFYEDFIEIQDKWICHDEYRKNIYPDDPDSPSNEEDDSDESGF